MNKDLFELFLYEEYISNKTNKHLSPKVISNASSRCKGLEKLLQIDLDKIDISHENYLIMRKKIKKRIIVNYAVYIYSLKLYFLFRNFLQIKIVK